MNKYSLKSDGIWRVIKNVIRTETTAVKAEKISDAVIASEAVNTEITPLPTLKNNISALTSTATKISDLEPVYSDDLSLRRAQSFDEVPGPKALRDIAEGLRYIPVIGTQITASTIQYMINTGSQLVWGRDSALIKWLLDEYGPVVRLQGPFGGNIVLLSRPEHVEAVFRNEGPFPIRFSLDCIEKYRIEYRNYKRAGPYLMHGPEWETIRNSIEVPMQNIVTSHYQHLATTSDRLVDRIRHIRNRQEEMPTDFYTDICKWSLECLCSVAFNDGMGFLNKNGLKAASEASLIINALKNATTGIRKCEGGLKLWMFYDTRTWKWLTSNLDIIDNIFNKRICAIQVDLKNNVTKHDPEKASLTEALLLRERMVPEDILTILVDMMLIGVNATSHALAFLLYHLARYPRVQRQLHTKIEEIGDTSEPINFSNIPYLQACIKESLRMKPPMPVLSRVLQRDVVINNYRIPRDTYVLMGTHLASLREENFENATKYDPNRWLSDTIDGDFHALASIPYGYGPKSCLARNLATLQLSMVLYKLVKNFSIEYHYGDISTNPKMLSAPNRPLRFQFSDRF